MNYQLIVKMYINVHNRHRGHAVENDCFDIILYDICISGVESYCDFSGGMLSWQMQH